MMEQDYISRKIMVTGIVTDDMAEEIIERIILISDYDDKMESALTAYEREPIEMFINSVGGSASAGFAIISAMEMSATPITTYGLGMVASIALAIFVAGHVRVATRFARFMYHSVAYETGGVIQDHEDALRESAVIQNMYNTVLLENTEIPKEVMNDIQKEKKDFFFSAKRAVELKVADFDTQKPVRKSLGELGLTEELLDPANFMKHENTQ